MYIYVQQGKDLVQFTASQLVVQSPAARRSGREKAKNIPAFFNDHISKRKNDAKEAFFLFIFIIKSKGQFFLFNGRHLHRLAQSSTGITLFFLLTQWSSFFSIPCCSCSHNSSSSFMCVAPTVLHARSREIFNRNQPSSKAFSSNELVVLTTISRRLYRTSD